jgi:uncharacterized membrane protein YcjF (UPF0283 family)
MASNPRVMLDNSIDKLSQSDNIYSQLRDDLQIDLSDVYLDNTFDLNLFNKKYEDVRKRRQQNIQLFEQEKLKQLDKTSFKKKLHQYTVGELLFGIKDTIFGILIDLLNLQFTINTFSKQNRLFYIGLFIFIIIVILKIFE